MGSKVRYDAKIDMLYLVCDDGESSLSIEVFPGIAIEFGDAGNIPGIEILQAAKVLPKKSPPCSTQSRPKCCKESPSTHHYEPTLMARRQGDPGVRLQPYIRGLFSQAERLFLMSVAVIQRVQSSSTWGVPPHCTPFPEGPHPPICISAASAWGNQKVMPMERYRLMAVARATRASSRRPVWWYSWPSP
jgi:uncharacterized protein YuzE